MPIVYEITITVHDNCNPISLIKTSGNPRTNLYCLSPPKPNLPRGGRTNLNNNKLYLLPYPVISSNIQISLPYSSASSTSVSVLRRLYFSVIISVSDLVGMSTRLIKLTSHNSKIGVSWLHNCCTDFYYILYFTDYSGSSMVMYFVISQFYEYLKDCELSALK